MSCLCVCGVVEFEVELGIKLVLHHAAVADKTAIVEVIQWSRVEGRNLRGEGRRGEGELKREEDKEIHMFKERGVRVGE